MQFLVTAYDAEDDGAQERRANARDAHIQTIDRYKKDGHMLIGAALLDDDGSMIGSSLIVDFSDEKALEAWLEEEPYVLQNVWEEVYIVPCAVGPSFMK